MNLLWQWIPGKYIDNDEVNGPAGQSAMCKAFELDQHTIAIKKIQTIF